MSRIFGHLCIRNEADRYLGRVLQHHAPLLDGIHVFDDASTDGTIELARPFAEVSSRHPSIPSFLEDESRFRQGGWDAMVRALSPVHDEDWILCLDADEFLHSGTEVETTSALRFVVDLADHLGFSAADLRIDEIFGVDEYGAPFRRTDGFWGTISGVRLVRYMDGGAFQAKKMGGGSVPTYWRPQALDARKHELSILHYGYARPADREAKYRRYSGIHHHGHNQNHIESIKQTPTLAAVDTLVPVGLP